MTYEITKKQNYVLPTVVLCVLILTLAVFTVMAIMDIMEISSQIKIEKQYWQANEQKLAQLEQLDHRKDELERVYDLLNRLIPMSADEDMLINRLDTLSRNAGLHLGSVEFGDRVVNAESNLNEMPVSLAFKGSYLKFAEILPYIIKGERLLRVEEIEIERQDGTNDVVNVKMKAKAFYR